MRLANKIALITGAASGFGEGIARTFAREGAKVAVVDIDEVAAKRVATEIGGGAIAICADVSRRADVDAAVRATTDKFGGLDILVNNAGVAHKRAPLTDVTEDEFDRIFAVNVKSIYLTAQAAVPVFRARGGGVIINIGSTAGLRPSAGLTWYNTSKGAVNTASKSMARELAADRIRVCALAPTIGETAMLPSFIGGDTDELKAKFRATVPLGRLSSPQDVANAALFFSSDEAAFLTGVVLEIDGGRSI
jgi:3-oxoacyl-[acyl-carrier protein] reductase